MKLYGFSVDGKEVYGDTFKYVDTYGLPLDFLFDTMRDKEECIDWMDFIREAIKVWPIRTVYVKIKSLDLGKEFEEKLKLAFIQVMNES